MRTDVLFLCCLFPLASLATSCGDTGSEESGGPVNLESDAGADAGSSTGADDESSVDATSPGSDSESSDSRNVDSQSADAPGAETGVEDTGESNDSNGGPSGGSGLEGYCEHYVDCGGTYYSDAEACVEESIDYWDECRRDELDAFGDCMLNLTCEEWGDPDAYNPSNTPCAEEWNELEEASCE